MSEYGNYGYSSTQPPRVEHPVSSERSTANSTWEKAASEAYRTAAFKDPRRIPSPPPLDGNTLASTQKTKSAAIKYAAQVFNNQKITAGEAAQYASKRFNAKYGVNVTIAGSSVAKAPKNI